MHPPNHAPNLIPPGPAKVSAQEKLSIDDAVRLARATLRQIVPEAQLPTVEEFEFDVKEGLWKVTVGYWLEPPATVGSKCFATALNREQRVFSISAEAEGTVVSMKIKSALPS